MAGTLMYTCMHEMQWWQGWGAWRVAKLRYVTRRSSSKL